MRRQVAAMLRCTLVSPVPRTNMVHAGEIVSGWKRKQGGGSEKIRRPGVTRMPVVPSSRNSGIRRWQTPSRREDETMTIRTRIALGISAAALSLSLALAPAAFAQDKMGKDDAMKKDTMSKDGMKKNTMSKEDGMKKDTTSKDGMKKDDGMMKKN
jgi:pentapeptide MXKDX repeat protein